MDKISDNYLMTKVKSGSINFAGLLFERYKKVLLAFFYNQTQDKSMCEDLVQVTFYKLIKYKNSYDPDKSFKSWIFTIARNSLKDELRKNNSKVNKSFDGLENLTMDDSFSDSNIEVFEKQEFLKLALGQLSAEKREILTMVKIHEKKYKEVAEILEKKESTVKSIVFRAILELQQNYSTLKNKL